MQTTEQKEVQTASINAYEDFAQLLRELSPERQQLVLDIIKAFARLEEGEKQNSDMPKNPGSLPLLLLSRRLEYEALSDEERARAEEEWEDFKASMNANRAPEPPLFV